MNAGRTLHEACGEIERLKPRPTIRLPVKSSVKNCRDARDGHQFPLPDRNALSAIAPSASLE